MNTPLERKKKPNYHFFILTILLLGSHIVSSQSHKIAFSLTGGIVQDGFGGMATLDYKVNDFDYLQFNVQASFTTLDRNNVDIPVNTYSFNPGFFFDVIRNNARTFALSLGAGGIIGYESINNGDETLENNQILNVATNTLIFGAYAGLDADIFLSPVISLNIKLNENYHINSEIGEFTPYAGLGVKLIFK